MRFGPTSVALIVAISLGLRPTLDEVTPLIRTFGLTGLRAIVDSRLRQALWLSPRPIRHLDATVASQSDIVRALRLSGVVVVENALSNETVDALMSELEGHFKTETRGIGGAEFGGGTALHTGRVGAIVRKSPSSHGPATHPLLLGAVEELLLPHTKKVSFKVQESIRMIPI